MINKQTPNNELWSLLTDALIEANENRNEKGYIVFNGQRPNEENYGTSPQNPLCSTSLAGTDVYLSRLRTTDGKKFTWQRIGNVRTDCNGATDIGIDKYQLYLDERPYKILYFVPYVGESTTAPHGMRLCNSAEKLDTEVPSVAHIPVKNVPQNIFSEYKHTKGNYRVKVYTKETHHISNKSTSVACSSSIEPPPIRKSRYKVLFVVFLMLFTASLIGNIFLFINNSALNKEISSLEISISDLNKEKTRYYDLLTSSQHEVDFYETRIVICDFSEKLYHAIDCSLAKSILVKYNIIDYFYLDSKVAEQYGYSPCNSCSPAQHTK